MRRRDPKLSQLQIVSVTIALSLCGGCCGGQLCSTRFDQPIHHLGQTPDRIPYSEPPCGFQTVGGPPHMAPETQGRPDPWTVNAPVPKFIPVPTRPVFGAFEPASFAQPAAQAEKESGERIWPKQEYSPATDPPGSGADPPSPPEEIAPDMSEGAMGEDGMPMNRRSLDAGPMDGRPMDARPMDTGPMDTGPMDARPMNGGPMDVGPMSKPIDGGEAKPPEAPERIPPPEGRVAARPASSSPRDFYRSRIRLLDKSR